MRSVRLDGIKPGMRLARTLTDASGQVLLSAGVTLRPEFVEKLRRRGFEEIFVTDGALNGIEVDEPISHELRGRAREAVERFVDTMRRQAASAVDPSGIVDGRMSVRDAVAGIQLPRSVTTAVTGSATDIVDEIMALPSVIVALVDLETLDDAVDSTLNHSIQVCVLAVSVGRAIGLDRPQQIEIGVAALLHDLGKTLIPGEVFFKPDKLTEREWAIMKTHPAMGHEILRRTAGLGGEIALAAYQHHERVDGSGYPRGITGRSISFAGRICAVCDVYEAMTSPRRYKPAAHPSRALAHIANGSGAIYDEVAAGALARVVAPYPVHTMVNLSSGEVAVVRRLNPGSPDRPVVTAISSRDGRPYPDYVEYDLRKERKLAITGLHSTASSS